MSSYNWRRFATAEPSPPVSEPPPPRPCAWSIRSMPAQNALPLPASTMTRTSGSAIERGDRRRECCATARGAARSAFPDGRGTAWRRRRRARWRGWRKDSDMVVSSVIDRSGEMRRDQLRVDASSGARGSSRRARGRRWRPGRARASFSSSAPPGGTATSASLSRTAAKTAQTTQAVGMFSDFGQNPSVSDRVLARVGHRRVDDARQYERNADVAARQFGAQRLGQADERELARAVAAERREAATARRAMRR